MRSAGISQCHGKGSTVFSAKLYFIQWLAEIRTFSKPTEGPD